MGRIPDKYRSSRASFPERPMTGTLAPSSGEEAHGRVPMFSVMRGVSSSPEMRPVTRARPAEGEAQITDQRRLAVTSRQRVRGGCLDGVPGPPERHPPETLLMDREARTRAVPTLKSLYYPIPAGVAKRFGEMNGVNVGKENRPPCEQTPDGRKWPPKL